MVDRIVKTAKYARAGIPRYWIVERDSARTVHRHVFDRDAGEYECDPGGRQPIAWLLTRRLLGRPQTGVGELTPVRYNPVHVCDSSRDPQDRSWLEPAMIGSLILLAGLTIAIAGWRNIPA